MQTALFVIGGLVVAGGLAGFFISFWRPAPKSGDFSESSYTDHGSGDGH
jgi:hypothetical protein